MLHQEPLSSPSPSSRGRWSLPSSHYLLGPRLPTYHEDEDSEFRPVQLRGHLPGDAVLPVGPLPHLPLHKATIQAPACAARAPASHFREVTFNAIDLGQGVGCRTRRERAGRRGELRDSEGGGGNTAPRLCSVPDKKLETLR